MQEGYSNPRWENHQHKSLAPSLEHSDLQDLESKTGHLWERTALGEIKFYPLENLCQGPMCISCGFRFCIDCRLPVNPARCLCKPMISSGPMPKVDIPAAERYPAPAATTLISSSLREERAESTSEVA